MTENVIVLPGTRWQIPLVKKLKKRGYYVIVFDLYEDQPAYRYADEYYIIDILDKEKCLETAKKFNPVAVMSDECDIAIPTIAWVAEQLKKPSIGMEMAELYTNKYKMREFAREKGFSVPEFYKCMTKNSAVITYRHFGKKMIMKPLDANSSRGVYSIESEEDIINHFEEVISFSKKEKSILLEEYIEGEEFSVDGIKIGSEYYSLSTSKKIHYPYNENLDKTLFFSYEDSSYDYNLLRKINEKYVRETGLSFGLTHAEYKYRDGKFYMIEIGARGGGNLISSVINPNMSGIDAQEYLIDWATGKMNKNSRITFPLYEKSQYAVLDFFDTDGTEGFIKRIEGKLTLEKYSCVQSYYFFYDVGDYTKNAKDGGTRFGYYIVCCKSKEEMQEVVDNIRKSVKIIVD